MVDTIRIGFLGVVSGMKTNDKRIEALKDLRCFADGSVVDRELRAEHLHSALIEREGWLKELKTYKV